MSVCRECCVLSGRGLCDELITRPKESYRLWCVVVCDLETSWMRRPWPNGCCCAKRKKEISRSFIRLPSTPFLDTSSILSTQVFVTFCIKDATGFPIYSVFCGCSRFV
jgi:hypothetical protein